MQEKHKVRRAFGYIYDYGEYPSGHIFNDTGINNNILEVVNNKVPYEWLFLEGEITLVPVNGGGVVTARRGSLGSALGLTSGKYRITVASNCRLVCFPAATNAAVNPPVPVVQLIAIRPNESIKLPVGSKFFLADGSMQIAGRSIGTLQTLRVSTETVAAVAATDCLGLLFA